MLRDVVEHEAAALAVGEDSAFAAHAFGDEDAAHARRPHHPGRVELDELHVDQLGPGLIGERVAVAGVFPAVARDFVGAADAAGREHDGLRAKHLEPPALALVPEGPDDTIAVLQQPGDRALHVHVDALMNAVILERADHLEPRAIADVREPRIAVAAEVPLKDPSILRAIEQRAPGFELAHAIRRFLRVQLGHAPVVHVLAAAHGVAEVDLPVVAIVDVTQRCGDAALGHHGVRFSQQRLAYQSDRHAGRRRLNGRPAAPLRPRR